MTTARLPISVDVARTGLHAPFLEHFEAGIADVIGVVDREPFDAAAVVADPDGEWGYSGWSYWLLYLKGFLQFRASGAIARGNVYVDYFLDHYLDGPHDPGLRLVVPDDDAALARVTRRFADTQRLLGGRRPGPDPLPPIRILASHRPVDDTLDVRDATNGLIVKARAIDGWHRMFGALLGGRPTLRGEVRLDESTWTSAP